MSDPRLEERLREVLSESASAMRPPSDWGDVVDRSARLDRRRETIRRAGLAVAAAAGVVVAVVLATVDQPFGDEEQDVMTTPEVTETTVDPITPSTTDTTIPSTTATTDQPQTTGREVDALELPAGAPLAGDQVVVGIWREGDGDPATVELAVISALDGSMVRVLDTVGTSEGGITDIVLSPDRRTVITTQGTSASTGPVRAYPADGSGGVVEYDEFANALELAISAEGTMLAVTSDDDVDGHGTLSLWPLGSGSAHAYVYGDGGTDLAGLPAQVPGTRPGSPSDAPTVRSVAFAADGSLSYVTADGERLQAYRLPRPGVPAAPYETAGVTYRAFASGGTAGLLVLADTPSGRQIGELDTDGTGVVDSIDVGDDVLELSGIAGEPMWVTADRQLFRLLEGNTHQVRSDIADIGS